MGRSAQEELSQALLAGGTEITTFSTSNSPRLEMLGKSDKMKRESVVIFTRYIALPSPSPKYQIVPGTKVKVEMRNFAGGKYERLCEVHPPSVD